MSETQTPLPSDVDIFCQFAAPMMFRASKFKKKSVKPGFKSFFGVRPAVCALVWQALFPRLPNNRKPVHLLWALLLLKVYATEHVNCAIAGVDEKTFRKWAWVFVDLIADMRLISWERRYENRTGEAMVPVDGSDFRIYEPYPFDPKRCSHKFHGPGLRYEVGLCVSTGHIIWVNGPFPCGSHSDLKIFQLSMKNVLDANEVVIADGVYSDERCKKTGKDLSETRFYSVVRARHETVNRRMKHFNVLSGRFRHRLSLHSSCFHAIANLTQVVIEHCEPLFSVVN